jgi:hypothetical protein
MASIGKGTTLGYSAIPATSYTSVGEVTNVSIPEITMAKVDVTHYGSSAKAYAPSGWADYGDVEVEITYAKAQCATLESLIGTEKTWKVTLSDSSYWVFTGFIGKLGGATPIDNVVTTTLTITITGLPDFTAA